MHVLITGGTGFIGCFLVPALVEKNYKITILSRKNNKNTENVSYIQDLEAFSPKEKVDIVINLAGAPISKRWTKAYKKKLVSSRVNITQKIINFCERQTEKPAALISASAIGYYGVSGDAALVETSSAHEEFTHQLCKQWEESAQAVEALGVRLCIARLGIVLGKGGGALKQMLPPFKAGLGGRMGDGQQYMSWIAMADVVAVLLRMIEDASMKGVYNVTAPNSVKNKVFAKTLAAVVKRPCILPMPSFTIKLMFGEMGDVLLLNGQNVMPKRLLAEGFKFEYPDLESALKEAV